MDPDEMTALSKVIDEACLKLGRTDEATKEVMAMRVISCALRGERDVDNLLSIALNGKKIANAE